MEFSDWDWMVVAATVASLLLKDASQIGIEEQQQIESWKRNRIDSIKLTLSSWKEHSGELYIVVLVAGHVLEVNKSLFHRRNSESVALCN